MTLFPTDVIALTDQANIAIMLTLTEHMHPWRLPLVTGARDAGIATLAVFNPTVRVPLDRLPAQRPAIVLIGDDDDKTGLGPAGWRDAWRVIDWTRFGLIHAAPGEPQHYARAVEVAKIFLRVLLVETSPAQAEKWVARIKVRGRAGEWIAPAWMKAVLE
jgi:hypothetical protein